MKAPEGVLERIIESYSEIGENLTMSKAQHVFDCQFDEDVEVDEETRSLIQRLTPFPDAGPIPIFPPESA